MNKEYILITGATGFIGSHVADKFMSDDGYQVVAIVRKPATYKNTDSLKKKGAILIEGDFIDGSLLKHVFDRYPIRYIVHIAALRGPGAGGSDDFERINVKGTEMLLEAALERRVKKFVYCSSVGVFGTIPRDVPAHLGTQLYGDNDYHTSKIRAEKTVQEYIVKGLNAFIVRPTITYGSGDSGFPFTLIKLIRKRMLLLPFRDTKIHLLHADSLAQVFMQIVKKEDISGRIFLIADQTAVSLKSLVDMVHYALYGTQYPSFLRMPDLCFSLLRTLFHLFGWQKWVLRISLISQDWYYDISATIRELDYRPVDTFAHFTGVLKEH